MFAEDIRRALLGTPRHRLADLSAAVWKGYACGAIGENEAQRLAEEIETRKAVPNTVGKNDSARRVGSRPRAPESLERRRRWAASSWLPPHLASKFTPAEQAALGVVLSEIALTGRCELSHGAIGGRAGVSVSTVKRAIGEARRLGLLSVEERRLTWCRNLPNRVTLASAELRTWVATRGRGLRAAKQMWGEGGGVQTGTATESISCSSAARPAPATRDRGDRWEKRPRQASKMDAGGSFEVQRHFG